MIVRALFRTAVALACVTPGRAGQEPAGPYVDRVAERLHVAAVANRDRIDETVLEYTALVRQRVGAALRTPLKDRTLYRSESAHRAFWKRDGELLVQVLALREQTPAGVVQRQTHQGLFDEPFDPMNDRLLFGFARKEDDLGDADRDDFWFEHPLYMEYRDSYRFASGDTLTLSLPDGRLVQAVELRVLPTEADVHRMTGSLWIEPRSGALVRAVYRLADTFDAFRDIPDLREEEDDDLKFVPGIFKPWTAEISMIAVDYSLWNFDVWLPRSMRAEGVVSAGILRAPATIDISYQMESVVTREQLDSGRADADVEEVRFRTRSEAMAYLAELAFEQSVPYALEPGWSSNDGRRVRYLVPEDPAFLLESPQLPPPVWEDAPGFASQGELEELFSGLADLPRAPVAGVPTTFRWGLQRPDLIRYNRVEALSIGVRGQARPQSPLGPLSLTGTVRMGVADREPNVRLDVARETLRRRVVLSGYSELAAIDERGRHLRIGNSILAAVVGRDDGDYYRRSGVAATWTPPSAGRPSFAVRGYAEYHRAAPVETNFSLLHVGSDSWAFRDNVVADEGWEYGGAIELSPWWGTDPNLLQAGLDARLQAGTGDVRYARASLLGRLVLPLPADLRLGLEAGGGSSIGTPSAQRLWYVGGSSTLRGYAPRSMGGTAFARARGELARSVSFGAISLFTDLAWAGDRAAIRLEDSLYSLGAGLSLLDGLLRFDAAWGLRAPRDFRFDVYLDAML